MIATLFDTVESEKFASDMRPRPYQAEAIEGAFREFDAGEVGALIRQPTGSGKTVVASWIADLWCQRSNNHFALVLCHERQLVQQFKQEVEDVLGIPVGLEMGTDGSVDFSDRPPQIIVASRASLYEKQVNCEWCRGDGCDECDEGITSVSRLYKFDWKKNWLLVVDECHRYKFSLKSCRHIFEWFEKNTESRRLGLSATPQRGDGVSLSRLFPGVALDYPAYDLNGGRNALDDGWSVPFDQRFVTVEGLDWKNIREVAGDFADDDLEQILLEEETLRSLVVPTLELVEHRQTLIFSPGVAMAKAVARLINALSEDGQYDCGTAEWLDGSVPDQSRQDTYARFERKDIQFLSVCGLCREGYNNRGIQAVAIYRPTKSLTLAEQMKGRGTRPLRGVVDGVDTAEERRDAIAVSDKPTCMIVDLVGITGLPPVASTAHLLATGKPDEVIELANKNAIEADGPVDMVEEIEKAEKQIDEEKENARLERIRKEQAEEEEARKKAQLQADVRYTDQVVADGHGGSAIVKTTSPARMIWGKHKGKSVSNVPTDYLEWALKENFPFWLKGEMKKEIQQRTTPATPVKTLPSSFRPGDASSDQQRVLVKFGYSPNVSDAQAREIIMNKINPKLRGEHE